MTTAVLGALLIVAAVAVVALPFVRPAQRERNANPEDGRRQALEAQKLEAYAAIRDAELDFRMGKLSEADFGTLRETYAQRALAALAELEQLGAGPAAGAGGGPGGTVAFCPACGWRTGGAARFCGACGLALPRRPA